ncbi:hypothetical protein VF21_07010 [Pseudogymnoascus sp. 05NY08]|nr:hypothetical protein VF21_07010 [Pseudogymnoascus sp. 05NY08]
MEWDYHVHTRWDISFPDDVPCLLALVQITSKRYFLGRPGVQWWGDPVSDGSSTTFLNDWLRIVDATTSLQRQVQLSMIPVLVVDGLNGGDGLNFQDFQDLQDNQDFQDNRTRLPRPESLGSGWHIPS